MPGLAPSLLHLASSALNAACVADSEAAHPSQRECGCGHERDTDHTETPRCPAVAIAARQKLGAGPLAATTETVNLGGDRTPEDVRLAGRAGGRNVGERNGQYRHGERTKAAIAEQRKFSALLKMLRAGLT